MRRFLSVIIALATAFATFAGDYDSVEQVRNRLEHKILDGIEGIWQFTGDGAIVAIEKDPASDRWTTTYRMVVIDAPQPTLLPGTVMGTVRPTVKPDVFEASILTQFSHSTMRLSRAKSFIITLKNARITIKPLKSKISVNPLRLIPYAYRLGLSYRNTRPDDLDGCVRLFPAAPTNENPVYL